MKESQKKQISRTLKKRGIKPPSRKGIKHTEKTKQKMSRAHMGKIYSKETKKKISEIRKAYLRNPQNHPRFGKPFPFEVAKKISNSKKRCTFTINHRMKLSVALQGRKLPQETKDKMGQSRRDINHPMWRGGISESYRNRRTDRNWREIVKKIFARDDYTCQRCKKRGGRLHTHHIVPFRLSEDDNFDNLITLCPACHIKEELDFYKNSGEIWEEPLIQEFPE